MSDLVRNHEDGFSCVEAHMIVEKGDNQLVRNTSFFVGRQVFHDEAELVY